MLLVTTPLLLQNSVRMAIRLQAFVTRLLNYSATGLRRTERKHSLRLLSIAMTRQRLLWTNVRLLWVSCMHRKQGMMRFARLLQAMRPTSNISMLQTNLSSNVSVRLRMTKRPMRRTSSPLISNFIRRFAGNSTKPLRMQRLLFAQNMRMHTTSYSP